MMNGATLKTAFIMIVFTLCSIVMFLVIGVIFFKFPIDDTKMMLGMLGISALFGGITQAFIHSNIAEGMKPDPGSIVTSSATITQKTANPAEEEKKS